MKKDFDRELMWKKVHLSLAEEEYKAIEDGSFVATRHTKGHLHNKIRELEFLTEDLLKETGRFNLLVMYLVIRDLEGTEDRNSYKETFSNLRKQVQEIQKIMEVIEEAANCSKEEADARIKKHIDYWKKLSVEEKMELL